jgi:hypothetical protein
MFKEFAVEPEAITGSYRDFAYVIEKFGVPEGRWISRFPKSWKALVYESAKAKLGGTKELTKIEERLRRVADDILIPSGRAFASAATPWIDAAVAEHRARPFDALVASTHRDDPPVVALADLDSQHPCLAPNRQWIVPRTAADLAACCAPLIRTSHHVKLVDPHLDPSAGRFRRTLAQMLASAQPGSLVDVFRGDSVSIAHARDYYGPRLATLKPPGVRLRLFLRPQDPLHNRYVLTSRGGVAFLTGLDDANGGQKTHDDVFVLDTSTWQARWATYAGEDAIAEWV